VEHLEVLLVEEHHQLEEEELLYHHQLLLQVLLKQLDMTIIVLVVMRATQTLMQEIHTQRLDMQQEGEFLLKNFLVAEREIKEWH
jgi:hypothetical protein